jgi:Tfp pilus assembly protein PilV
MRLRLRENDGFLLIEVLVAALVLSIAILALMAIYSAAFLSLHNAAKKTAAATLAQNQLELYSALQYANIGLDSASLTTARANATYLADDNALTVPTGATASDVALATACTSTQCLPIQSLTGNDRRGYTVETFVRDITGAAYTGRSERVVTIIVRDPSSTGAPIVAQMSSAYDAGP